MAELEALESGTPPTLLQTLRAHGTSGEITCCDVSPGGARLLTGGGDRALRAWCWQAGSGWEPLAAALRAHRYGITVARWSPGGALAASGGVDGAARVWSGRELASRRLLASPGAPALRSMCWASAGVLLCGYDDGSACVWSVQRAALMARLHAHEGALHAVASPARGALLLTACTEGVLKVFDLQEICRSATEGADTPAPLLWCDGAHDLGVLCCDVTKDGGVAATGGHDARIRLWRVRGAGGERRVEEDATLEGHGAAVTAVRWADRVLASAALDRTARIWSADGACLCVLHAHNRYLTCVALAPDLRYIITGSNDKSVRLWALGNLTLNDELEPPCTPLSHFGVGDLEGIGPVEDEELLADGGDGGGAESREGEGEEAGAARLVYRSTDLHGGAVNSITVHGDCLATACSDGVVRVFSWDGGTGTLEPRWELGERGYPAMAADLGAGGAVLLTAGLDGSARLWDIESGCLLRSLAAPTAAEHESGGGGARSARVSPHRPALLLLATDDGLAPLWSLADREPAPTHVFGGLAEAALCCAWSACGRAAAVGGEAGELRIVRPPPAPQELVHTQDAHDLGVQSCDFAPSDALNLPTDTLLLATAGSDALIKLWKIQLYEEECSASMSVAASVVGHGGGATSARWGTGGRLATAGADGWARVWQLCGGVGEEDTLRIFQIAAVPAQGAAGTATAVLLDSNLVVLGSVTGEVAVWRFPTNQLIVEGCEEEVGGEDIGEEDAGAEPRWWGARGVARWIRDYITRVPGVTVSSEVETELLQLARDSNLSGAQLLDMPIENLLQTFGCGSLLIEDGDVEQEKEEDGGALRERLRDELLWLRRDPPPPQLMHAAPHWLRCPLSHALCSEPARAADGVTYDRNALHEWFLAADGAVSAVSGRRLLNSRVIPNYAARAALRDFLQEHTSTGD
ncbi:hypothetical protein NE865_12883 [Phthorimaea operculella]|nr:hypothetical protein NE865_12883 [Phthorimaea operculella]